MLNQISLRRPIAAALCSALGLLTSLAPCVAQSKTFLANESLVTSQSDLFDPEYSQMGARVTWIDRNGALWIADIDRDTGLFRPANGRGVLVDPDAMSTSDIKSVGNGPEWLGTAGDDRVVYTRYVAGQPHTRDNARVAMAWRDAKGTWRHKLLGDLPRYGPMSSPVADDGKARIVSVGPNGSQYWREADNPASEALVPWVPASARVAMRLVNGARAIVFLAPVEGSTEVFRYWLDSQVVEQLTFDGDHDDPAGLYMWRAPEFDNDFVFMILAKGRKELRIYRQLDKAKPQWTVIHVVREANGAKLGSPEPFVHKGKSYIFMEATLPPNQFPSAIFLSNIDATRPLFRRLTPVEPLRVRADPEVFVTSDGPHVYYNRAVPGASRAASASSEGIYRTATGLAPP